MEDPVADLALFAVFVATLCVAAWSSDRLGVHWSAPVLVVLALWVVGFAAT